MCAANEFLELYNDKRKEKDLDNVHQLYFFIAHHKENKKNNNKKWEVWSGCVLASMCFWVLMLMPGLIIIL